MNWPSMSDYQEVIQNPKRCFSDPELKLGMPALNALGLPQPVTGGFCSVYQVADGKSRWAVRCFLHNIQDLRERYAELSRYLRGHRLKPMVGFEYVAEGIRVRDAWHPVLKMEWVDGETLDRWVERHLDDPRGLKKLADQWAELMHALEKAHIGHCDLQHGNVLVDRSDQLRLIDYDGMYVPPLRGRGSHEKGHAAYQHPKRNGKDFDEAPDRFSALVIHTSLVALAESRELWQRFYMEDNLLFSRADFQHPEVSPVFSALQQLGGTVADHAAILKQACVRELSQSPRLRDVRDGKLKPQRPAQQQPLPAAVPAKPAPARRGARGATPVDVAVHAHAVLAGTNGAASSGPRSSGPAWLQGAIASVHAAVSGGRTAHAPSRGATAAALAHAEPVPEPAPEPVPNAEAKHSPVLRLLPKKRKRTVTPPADEATAGWSLEWTRPGVVPEAHVWQLPVYGQRETPRRVLGLSLGNKRERFVESYEEKLEERGTRVAGHRSKVTALAFSPDGRLLVSASRDGTLRVWSVAAARETYAPLATGSSVLAMALVPERLCVAAVLADGRLVLWDFGSHRRVTHVRASDGSALRAVAVSSDGRWVVAGGNQRRLYLWQTERGVAARDIGPTAGRVEAVAFTPDSGGIACGTHNRRVEMFERDSGARLWSVRSGRARIAAIAAAGRGGPLVTAAADGTIVSWDTESGAEQQRSRPMPGRLATLAMVPDASLLLAGFATGKAVLSELGAERELAVLGRHPGSVSATALAQTRKCAATGSADGTIRLWNAP